MHRTTLGSSSGVRAEICWGALVPFPSPRMAQQKQRFPPATSFWALRREQSRYREL